MLAAAAAAALFAAVSSVAAAESGEVTIAQSQYSEGDFAHAQASFEEAVRNAPRDLDARLGAATLELYRNDLRSADRNISAALKIDPANARARALRATAGERRGAPGTFAASFTGGAGAEVPFASSVPLPTIRVRLGDREAVLAVDTTAPGLLLAPALASELGLSGRDAVLDRMQLGKLEVRRVPVHIGPISGMSGDHDPIEGAIGPLFFSHFLVTIDYPRGRLVIRPAASEAAFAHAASLRHAGAAAMWIAPDYDLFAEARVNSSAPGLYSVDVREAENGLALTPQTMQRARIPFGRPNFEREPSGRIRRVPFSANLTLGSMTIPNLDGTLDPLGINGASPFLVSGSIGAPAFAGLAITFDFATMRIFLERSAPAMPV